MRCEKLPMRKSNWKRGSIIGEGLGGKCHYYLVINDYAIVNTDMRVAFTGTGAKEFSHANKNGGSWHVCQKGL